MPKVTRGSDALLSAYKAGGHRIDERFVGELAGALTKVPIHDILIKGQPHPDFLKASFVLGDVKKDAALLTDLLGILAKPGHGLAGGLRIFPRGIPWPGEFVVDVTVGQHQI